MAADGEKEMPSLQVDAQQSTPLPDSKNPVKFSRVRGNLFSDFQKSYYATETQKNPTALIIYFYEGSENSNTYRQSSDHSQ